MKTKISFVYVNAGGFHIEGYGNFFPRLTRIPKELPGILGNTWVEGHDPDELYTIELPDENVPELPAHVKAETDEETRLAFQRRAAEKAAEQHAANNAVRDVLKYHQEVGRIKIVSDTFFDKPVPEKPKKQAKDEKPPENKDQKTEE